MSRVSDPNGILFVGYDVNHENTLPQFLYQGYGSSIPDRVRIMIDSPSNALSRASREDIPLVIFSSAGIQSYIKDAKSVYRGGVLMVAPLGSNIHEMLKILPGITCVVITAGSSTGSGCTTGYGNGLEFWDNNTYSSNSNSIIAGKLLKIKESLSCSWWEARHRARVTAYRTLTTHPDGELWNENNGYGRIDLTKAISWVGTVPPDPFLGGKR